MTNDDEIAAEREQAKWEKRQANREYKPPRQRSIKVGSGTNVGYRAGDSVKLRQEIDT